MTEEVEVIEEQTFDFTGVVETFEGERKQVYSRLRRVAILNGDESQLPDGKVYSKAQVVEILGEDYAGASIPGKCC